MYNFLLFYASLISLLHVSIMIYIIFTKFCWTILLTQCQLSVDVFCMFLVSRFISRNNNFSRRTMKVKGDHRGGGLAGHAAQGRTPTSGVWAHPRGHLVHLLAPPLRL